MRCLAKTIEHDSRSDVFRIVPLGDVHLGAAACDERLFQQTVDYIKDTPATFWVGMGDLLECIPRCDKRHDERVMAKWLHGKGAIIKYQRDKLIDILKPIGPRCLGYAIGNHEMNIEQRYSSDAYLDVIEAIRATEDTDLRLDISGYIMLKFRRANEGGRKGGTRTLVMDIHHGWAGGDYMSGPALKLEHRPAAFDADVHCFGHSHKKLAFPVVKTGVMRNGKIYARNCYCISTGSFMKTAIEDGVTYTERYGKKPVALGAPEIEFRPGAEDDGIRVIV